MASRKDIPVLIACQGPSGRVTRAQVANSSRRCGVAHPALVPVRTEQKPTAKGKTKRGALDENTCVSAVASAPHPKRRAVLKDVTNISCANSYRNCTAVTKLQLRPTQKVGRNPSKNKQRSKKVPKPPLPAVSGTSFVNDCHNVEEAQKEELSPPKEEPTALLENKGSLLQNTEWNRESGFHEAFFHGRTTRDKFETANSNTGDYAGLNIIDIDKDNGNPQMCISYAAEIYTNLMAAELIRRPKSNYMETLQRDITKGMRGILIDWLVEVAEEYKLVPDTLYLTVYLIDQFLSWKYIERQKLQLLGITSMLIASKYEEICAPRVEEFCFITDNTYTKDQVLKMECQVLNGLGYNLSVPTIKTFLRRFLRAAQASHKNCTLEHYTSYKSSDIQICVCALWELQGNTNRCPLNAIREKYQHKKFECVANMLSPELAQSLFSRQANDTNPLLINDS
ncbi:Cyclin-A2-1 [Triticum urartu]|uniref:Cyclin-A2-1 n=1 Tax=Triticum urartu TaxID=4572 RepID=M7Z411_TRIUA|nr:Cyclin-A2-1 [Triticum urartu]